MACWQRNRGQDFFSCLIFSWNIYSVHYFLQIVRHRLRLLLHSGPDQAFFWDKILCPCSKDNLVHFIPNSVKPSEEIRTCFVFIDNSYGMALNVSPCVFMMIILLQYYYYFFFFVIYHGFYFVSV